MSAESIKQELEEEAKEYKGKHLDVDKESNFLQKRARKWAEYDMESFNDNRWRGVLSLLCKQDEQEQQKLLADIAQYGSYLFSMEKRLIWTTKPHTHKALFIEAVIKEYISKAHDDDYFLINALTEKGMSLLGLTLPDPYSPKPAVQYPDFGSIKAIAEKDKELFPDPEPIRTEVAGAIINYTSWEAVLVVYTDCTYIGETLHISLLNDPYLEYVDSKFSTAKVVERIDGAGKNICAAIFPHIPFVTDYHRSLSQVVTRVDCRVSYWSASDREKPTYTETIILSRGQVHDLDWRGVLPQREPQQQPMPQPQLTPQPTTSPTGATVTVKRVDRSRPNEYVYYLELVDPGHIEGSYEPQPLTIYFEGATEPESTASTSTAYGSSGTTARAEAGYIIPPPSTSGISQRPRKPKGSYWGKS